MTSSFRAVGSMSGSSLDGLDLCCADFSPQYPADGGDATLNADTPWVYRIVATRLIPYPEEWTRRLRRAPFLTGLDLVQLHVDYGHMVGQSLREFIDDFNLSTEETEVFCVSSSGHTLFHQPGDPRKLTFQLGEGETIASYLKFPFVDNFRSKDVALGGQGAPLVPAGEIFLHNEYDVCLNLGGIANITVLTEPSERLSRDAVQPSTAPSKLFSGRRLLAYDISPCNMMLNYLAGKLEPGGQEFDRDGQNAASGSVIQSVLEQLDALQYYHLPPGPKSLGQEWFEEHILPLLDTKTFSVQDLLRTAVEHVSRQIARNIISTALPPSCRTCSSRTQVLKLLITGGGYRNRFLAEQLRKHLEFESNFEAEILIDFDQQLVDFKEALIFAFLGLRCLLGLPNVACSATGATVDTVSGAIHRGADKANEHQQKFKL